MLAVHGLQANLDFRSQWPLNMNNEAFVERNGRNAELVTGKAKPHKMRMRLADYLGIKVPAGYGPQVPRVMSGSLLSIPENEGLAAEDLIEHFSTEQILAALIRRGVIPAPAEGSSPDTKGAGEGNSS